ncbi:hypothetical protein BsWGS_16534 [Bradybaena similaris]
MSQVHSPGVRFDRVDDSPCKSQESLCVSAMPEGSVCAALTDDTSNDGRCDSLWSSSTCSQDSFKVEPRNIITDDMLREERRLQAEGLRQEEKRIESQAEVLSQLSDQTQEMHYERLKYLLNKSTMYTEYLVSRIKKQKEEEDMRRARILQKIKEKQKKEAPEEEKEVQSQKEEEQNMGLSSKRPTEEASDQEGLRQPCRTRGGNKRTIAKTAECETVPESKAKRQKKLETSPSPPVVTTEQDLTEPTEDRQLGTSTEDRQLGTSPVEPSQQGTVTKGLADEPELIEKAKTFGVVEETDERRFINGEEVSFLQPTLMEGGVLRSYQLEGYSWLKVLYENGVNGILADEMGLGKTVQCVAILAHLVYMGIPGPFFVCAPLSTIPNWFAEFQKFAPKVPTILYHGDKNRRVHLAKKIRHKHKIRDGVFVQPVVITSYEVAMIDRKYLANHEWKYLIVDEGHRIKNTHCRLIRELRMYRSTHRLLLTGTPLQNSLAELWSLLNFLLPEIFNDLGSFEAWFDVSSINEADAEEKILQQERAKNILSMLHQILTPFMLRRLKSDVDLNIPPKKEVLVFAPMTQQQRHFYSALVDRTIFSFIDQKNTSTDEAEITSSGRPKRRSAASKIDYALLMETEADRKSNKICGERASRRRWKDVAQEEKELEDWIQAVCDAGSQKVGEEKKQRSSQVTIKMRNVMMQLRKCCNHPYLLEHPVDPKTGELALTPDVITVSGKMLVLDKMLAELKKRGHRVLIFSQMTRMLDLIEDFCYIRKYDFCRLDGSTRVDDRRDSMNTFNTHSSDKFLFLLSTRAGGLGINLTGADTVIIYDSDWNPQCDLQAQDRCHRIGQTKPVVVYRLVTANTIDQKIIERAAAKRKLEKMIIHKGKFKSGNFMTKEMPISAEELRDLLHSTDHESEVIGDNFAISKTELNSLLDRSDLLEKWGQAKGPEQGDTKNESENAKHSEPKGKVSSRKCETFKGKTKSSHGHSRFFKILDTDDLSTTSHDTDDSLPGEAAQ